MHIQSQRLDKAKVSNKEHASSPCLRPKIWWYGLAFIHARCASRVPSSAYLPGVSSLFKLILETPNGLHVAAESQLERLEALSLDSETPSEQSRW